MFALLNAFVSVYVCVLATKRDPCSVPIGVADNEFKLKNVLLVRSTSVTKWILITAAGFLDKFRLPLNADHYHSVSRIVLKYDDHDFLLPLVRTLSHAILYARQNCLARIRFPDRVFALHSVK